MSAPSDVFPSRNTPTVPTDRHAALRAVRRDPVAALRLHPGGHEIELSPERPRFTVGATRLCDIPLEDPYVSSLHCVLERRKGGRLLVRDKSSKNGTFVNGNRVEVAELGVGGMLTVGGTRILALGRLARSRVSAREELVGEDPVFRSALDRALIAAASSCNVLVVGETGTGKELVARAIHEASGRAQGPFVAVNCGAITAELIESELFGHEKGAFTGAVGERDGVFVQADGGTLFLDELGELPRPQQPSLLRALESRTVRRVGGMRHRAVDIRLVTATNRLDLHRSTSPVRSDLYHRVATLVVELPPLRARRGDIPLLIERFLSELAPEFGSRSLPPGAVEVLASYRWPGNVRELRHAVHRAVALSAHQLRLEDSAATPGADPAAGRRALAGASAIGQRRDQQRGRTTGQVRPGAGPRARAGCNGVPDRTARGRDRTTAHRRTGVRDRSTSRGPGPGPGPAGAARRRRTGAGQQLLAEHPRPGLPPPPFDPPGGRLARHAQVDLRRQGPQAGHPVTVVANLARAGVGSRPAAAEHASVGRHRSAGRQVQPLDLVEVERIPLGAIRVQNHQLAAQIHDLEPGALPAATHHRQECDLVRGAGRLVRAGHDLFTGSVEPGQLDRVALAHLVGLDQGDAHAGPPIGLAVTRRSRRKAEVKRHLLVQDGRWGAGRCRCRCRRRAMPTAARGRSRTCDQGRQSRAPKEPFHACMVVRRVALGKPNYRFYLIFFRCAWTHRSYLR